jgi:hypothetical protein
MSRRSASVAATSSNNVTLALTKALQGVTKAEDGFSKSVTKLSELLTDTFNDLETRLEAKQKDLDELKLRYEQEEKNKKIEVDQNVRAYAYEAAKKILTERKEVAVREEDYEQLREDYSELRATKEQEIRDSVSAERKRNDQHNEALKRTLELQKQAEVAQVEARLETQIQHIEVLKSTIENLKNDLQAQRELTKDVAQAASKQMPMWQQPQVATR